MKTNEKGVTLVALVTVITIMLILIVASTYTVFDNNGLLKMAQKEKFISSVKMIQQKLEVSINEVKNNETYNVYGINTNTINAKNIINEIDSELSEKIDVVCGEVYFIGTDTTEIEWAREAGIKISGEIILEPTYIPEGFRKLDSVSLDNLFEGYVITDEPSGGEGGNEYVWVPVIGKIKRENSPILSDSVGKADCKDDVDEFIQSVELYKGFYVARYEAGVPNSASSSFQNSYTSTQAPESKKGLIPWTNVSYDNAKEKAQLVRNNSADFVKSDLMNSYAWDTIMKWVEANNFDVNGNSSNWGNRLDSTFSFTGNCARINSNSLTHTTGVTTKPQNQAFLIRTGNATSNESNNIYDLSGNASEWTTEFLRDNINTHILRGGTGETQGIVPANVRISSNNTSVSKGFRVILYMTGKSSHNEIGGGMSFTSN